jgi:hypothetical protein
MIKSRKKIDIHIINFWASPTTSFQFSIEFDRALKGGGGSLRCGAPYRSASIPHALHRVWLRIRFATHSTSLMQKRITTMRF